MITFRQPPIELIISRKTNRFSFYMFNMLYKKTRRYICVLYPAQNTVYHTVYSGLIDSKWKKKVKAHPEIQFVFKVTVSLDFLPLFFVTLLCWLTFCWVVRSLRKLHGYSQVLRSVSNAPGSQHCLKSNFFRLAVS